jgi:hypothetical protein
MSTKAGEGDLLLCWAMPNDAAGKDKMGVDEAAGASTYTFVVATFLAASLDVL